VRIVCISDTHERHDEVTIPDGDILIHAGDFTFLGDGEAIKSFNAWLGKLPHKNKVVVAGNHELTLWRHPELYRPLLTNCIYLEDTGVEIEGIKIWGSPVTPEFGSWAFMKKRGPQLHRHWEQIPDGLDILVTHGPPYGIGDRLERGEHVGDTDLLRAVEQKKPKYHICGHIHCAYGERDLGQIKYVNAAICDEDYEPTNKPIVIDIEPRF
jgi:Icc-related predicted phosphoesterase